MTLVEIRGFSYFYPGEDKPALVDINLDIEQGELVVLTGPSGSGKSTLGKALAGFLFQEEDPNYVGNVIVNKTDMTRLNLYHASERVAYVQQNPEDQFCTLTVLDEIAFALENACLSPEIIEERIMQVLEIVKGVNLYHRQLSSLSGGEKQKIAIASMLAISPDVLILDEPTSNLDPDATQHIFDALHILRNDKKLTVIIIEHKLSQLEVFHPRYIKVIDGKLTSISNLYEDNDPASLFNISQSTNFRENQNNTSTFLELSQLYVKIDDSEILRDINFEINPKEFIALMGPNGSGKSTLLQTIMGFIKPSNGKIFGFDRIFTQIKTSELVSKIGYIFQNPDHQLLTQSVWDEATLILKNLGMYDNANILNTEQLLDEIELGDRFDLHPHRLSYGEKRRLNLVAVILHNPKLLLIDEFLIGQDTQNARKWMAVLRDYATLGNAVVLVNHQAQLTQEYCDRVIFLDAGKIIVDAPVSQAFIALAQQGYKNFLPQAFLELHRA